MKQYSSFKPVWIFAMAIFYLIILPRQSQAQSKITVSGLVLSSEDKNFIAGASVMEKGANNGAVTDDQGAFTVSVASGATLVVTSIGYQPKEVVANNSQELKIELDPASNDLSDLIVVGYGKQKKSDLTGSIAVISPKDMTLGPSASFDQMLQGKAAGVRVVQSSGAPGGNVNITIRGISSITGGNSPLYVIDGFPIGTGGGGSNMQSYNSNSYSAGGMLSSSGVNQVNPLSSINPSDIQSIEILKDASATAIYGSRGANGVVIITTRRGALGKAKVSFNSSSGFQELAKKLDLLSPQQYAEFVADGRDNAWVYAGGNASDHNDKRNTATVVKPEFRDPASITSGTDWQDVIFRKSLVQNHELSATGGSKNVKYYLSGSYLDQEGIILGSDFKRYSLRSNIDAQLSSRIKITSAINASYAYGDFARAQGHLGERGLISSALASDPTIPIYGPNGNLYSEFSDPLGIPVENPIVIMRNFSDKRDVTTIFTNNVLEYNILSNLDFKTSFGVNYSSSNTRLWKSSRVGLYTSKTGVATAGVTQVKSLDYLNENTLNYHKTFNTKHTINALAGFSVQKNAANIFQAGASDFPTDQIPFLAAGQVSSGTNYVSEWSMASWFARLNYAYDSKYLLTATIRRDGSSRFGPKNKWGTFPSLAAGYNLSEESFMKRFKAISQLKIRASYGIAGNNLISNYASQGLLNITRTVSNGQIVSGVTPSVLANDNLTWEQSAQTNFGMDLSLFQNRISFTADFYKSIKKNLLLNVTLPAASGFSSSVQNIGKLENRGMEFTLNTQNIAGKKFKWSTSFNISANKNKVLALNGDNVRISNSAYQITEAGLPISSFYLLHAIGVFQTQEEIDNSPVQSPRVQPGDLKFKDVNGDGKITTADKDVIGSPWPDYIWGFDNNLTFGRFALGISINASHGNNVYFEGGEIQLNDAGVQNQLAIIADRWKSPSQPGNGMVPRAIRNDYAFTLSSSSRYLFDGSFVKIRNIHLSYNIPGEILKRLKLQALSVYADVSNAYTFTDYPSYDPEGSIGGDNITQSGVDYFAYPNPRIYTLGIRIDL